jgi:serine O-acetyltransferase
LHIGHFGNVIVNPRVAIGAYCNIAQGVTIGVFGRGAQRGVPVIGDHVHIGPNAVVAGKISVGDRAMISANSLVLRDVPPGGLARGVPARIFPKRDDEVSARAAAARPG